MNTLQGKRVLVLGLGLSGLALARWCQRWGAEVTVADTRQSPPQLERLRQHCPQARFVPGPLGAELVSGQQAVFKSPGLSPAETAAVVDAARAMGLHVGNELSLFARALAELAQPQTDARTDIDADTQADTQADTDAQAQADAPMPYRPVVLAVTGTNGKTTVTALTGQLVERAGKTVAVAGNIGPTLLDTLAQALDSQSLPEVWVLELSSFQLDGIDGFEPTAATVLNLTQDHLDWHGSMQAYAQAKARIYGQQALMLLNRDDPLVMAQLPAVAPGKGRAASVRAHQTFGADLPQRAGDWGLEVVSGMTWLVRAAEADETLKRRKAEQEEPVHIQRLMPAEALQIRGRHNACNALSALALATAAGCALAPMLHGLRQYRGEPHRVEPVGVIEGIEFFDDSKGTNVGATVAALKGLGAERRVVVILGGQGKGQDFTPLAAPVAEHARAALLIGRDAPLLRQALQASGVDLHDATDLPQAVRMALGLARSGDAVLLSPACASFDMFRDYGHRAEVFRQAVVELAQEQGVML
jgi:UDP-N-acetylmuramoylalanine--D-glutamate ligase